MILNEILTRYEAEYVPHIIDQRRTRNCIHRLQSIGDLDTSEITHGRLLEYRACRKREGVADSSCNKEMSILGSAIAWANREGLINYKLCIPRTKEEPRSESLTAAEVQKLIDCAVGLRAKAYIALLFATAQRKTAVATLKASQIRRGVIDFTADGAEMAHRRKRRSRVPVTPEIKAILDALRAAFGKTEYVFPNDSGKGSRARDLDIAFRNAAKAAGLDGVTPHILRHSACSVALAKGATMQQVSEFLGHSSVKITENVYKHLAPGFIASTVSAVGGSIKL